MGDEFKSLRCPECGGSLDNMDKKQDFVKCKYCGENLEKKALKQDIKSNYIFDDENMCYLLD